MNDQQLETRLRDFYRTRHGSLDVPYPLAMVVDAIPESVGEPRGFGPILGLPRRQATLLLAALLLAAALVGVVAVGTGILRLPWVVSVDAEPPLFGPVRDCGATGPWMEGAVLEANVGDVSDPTSAWVVLFEDGRLLTIDPWYPNIEATYINQRLTPPGVEMLLAAVTDAGLTAGCRSGSIEGPSLRLSAALEDGPLDALFGRPYFGEVLPIMGADERARLETLAAQITRPEDWLPQEAWIDPTRQTYLPDQWRVDIQWFVSDLPLGDEPEMQFADGTVMTPESLDLSLIRLPDGATLDDFGIEMPRGEGSPPPDEAGHRCGELGTDEALALADSLIAAGASHTPHDVWEIFSEDFSTNYIVQIQASLDGKSCEEMGRELIGPIEPIPTPKPLPVGDLSGTDACALVDVETVLAVLGPHLGDFPRELEAISDVSYLPFDVASTACRYAPPGDWAAPATLEVRGESTSLDQARYQARLLFGDGLIEEEISGRVVWLHACLAEGSQCTGALAISAEPYFLVVRAEVFGESPPPLDELTTALAEAIIERLAD